MSFPTRVITASECHQRLMAILDAVERGESFTVTYHGKVLAHITPIHHKKQGGNELHNKRPPSSNIQA